MEDDLCTAGYPEAGPDVGLLCNLLAGHPGDHRALAEVAFNYRRHVTWPQDGTVIVLSQAEFEAAGPVTGTSIPSDDLWYMLKLALRNLWLPQHRA